LKREFLKMEKRGKGEILEISKKKESVSVK
jgi:hypothetical protein